VLFTGFRHDIPEFLSEVQVSVLPSLSEALSNTLLESMAAGVPVVATRVGGNPEVVEHGVTGYLVPPREPEALAATIARILEQPTLAQAMGQAGRQRAVEHFSLDRLTQETESLYLRLLMKRRHRLPEAFLARRGGMAKAPVMGPEGTDA
jgi:glycosyltransferase involved in cell wall biosynthesis